MLLFILKFSLRNMKSGFTPEMTWSQVSLQNYVKKQGKMEQTQLQCQCGTCLEADVLCMCLSLTRSSITTAVIHIFQLPLEKFFCIFPYCRCLYDCSQILQCRIWKKKKKKRLIFFLLPVQISQLKLPFSSASALKK